MAAALFFAAAPRARGETCRSVEISIKPVANLQMAVWVEDSTGKYLDTLYVSRLTGTLGLANRPGHHFFKSDFRFPYGRRDMVLPVWAHKRNMQYGYVVMGGKKGNSVMSCAASGIPGSECEDRTIGYHFEVSSTEPFYCSPSGGVTTKVGGVDVMSCASGFYGSKGAFADAPAISLYPPRADLTTFEDNHDGMDARNFSRMNDLVAVSGATPPGDKIVDPPLRWTPPADGSYVMKLEVSLEKDFNTFHNHPSFDDLNSELNGYGDPFLGQPSVVYEVPFTVGDMLAVTTARSYAGYGDWDGATGTLHAPDMTITDMPGSGAGRLLDVSDQNGTWRVKLTARPECGPIVTPPPMTMDAGTPQPMDAGTPQPSNPPINCLAPEAPTNLTAISHPTYLEVSFASAAIGAQAVRFDVRYRKNAPITDDDFLTAVPADAPPAPGSPGSTVSMAITGLSSETVHHVAVRAIAGCGAASPIVTTSATTLKAQFYTLKGCFVATAAYGTPLALQIDVLRRLRDQKLLQSPLGKLAVASYYAFSPPLAAAISTDERLRAAARRLVDPIVRVTQAAERTRR